MGLKTAKIAPGVNDGIRGFTVYICACVSVRVCASMNVCLPVFMRASVRLCMRACLCVCACVNKCLARERI